MRFHLLAPPNVQTTRDYSRYAFCVASIRMARLLKNLGHEVLLYGSEENEAPCDELVKVITKEEQETLLDGIPYHYAAMFNQGASVWRLANNRTTEEIKKRKKSRDFILTISGTAQESIAKAHPDLMTVEYSVGYMSSFSKYRVYQSHVWRAWITGAQASTDGRLFDEVILLFYDESEYPFRQKKDPFVLYVGRVIVKKADNTFHGRQFEMDPFDPFQLYKRAPTPYCWYGVNPTLFDAPSRDERDELDWIAYSFLAASPLQGNRKVVMPLLGFSWGFHVYDETKIVLKPATSLTTADWQEHLPYLHECYPEWQFTEMSPRTS